MSSGESDRFEIGFTQSALVRGRRWIHERIVRLLAHVPAGEDRRSSESTNKNALMRETRRSVGWYALRRRTFHHEAPNSDRRVACDLSSRLSVFHRSSRAAAALERTVTAWAPPAGTRTSTGGAAPGSPGVGGVPTTGGNGGDPASGGTSGAGGGSSPFRAMSPAKIRTNLLAPLLARHGLLPGAHALHRSPPRAVGRRRALSHCPRRPVRGRCCARPLRRERAHLGLTRSHNF